MRDPRSNGAERTDRDASSGRFTKGNRAAAGRRSPLRAALLAAVKPSDFAAIAKAMTAKAKKGDTYAASWIADRLVGRPRTEPADETLAIDLPKLDSLQSCAKATAAIVAAAAAGRCSLGEAQAAVALVEQARQGLVAVEIEQRLRDLESVRQLEDRRS